MGNPGSFRYNFGLKVDEIGDTFSRKPWMSKQLSMVKGMKGKGEGPGSTQILVGVYEYPKRLLLPVILLVCVILFGAW
jgi:hypothetical protein